MSSEKYITANGISYAGTLPKIKKKEDVSLQPVFEAFTNSLESIKLRLIGEPDIKSKIEIKLFHNRNLFSEQDAKLEFDRLEIIDNGIGLNDKEFQQLINLNDDRKGFFNKGSGRVQFLHTFDKTIIESKFKLPDSNNEYFFRNVTLSKSKAFLIHNAIIRLDGEGILNSEEIETKLTFQNPLIEKDEKEFSYLTINQLKGELIRRYLAYFCENRLSLPQIILSQFENGEQIDSNEIVSGDIPIPDKDWKIEVPYCFLDDKNQIRESSRKEVFDIKSFKIEKEQLSQNELKLISKGEVAKNLNLEHLGPNDVIENNRYMFLLSGKFINDRDGDTRGELNIIERKNFKNLASGPLFTTEEVLFDDIVDESNKSILNKYEEIQDLNVEKVKNIQDLQEMFLLNHETLNSIKIGINDTTDQILKKVYEADAKISAKKDASIKGELDKLDELDPSSKDYQESLKSKVNELVKIIPMRDRTALAHYVARRKIVLELFKRVLDAQLDNLEKSGRIDEVVLHNLIFQQSSDNSNESDLWLINEDFIYFDGISEKAFDLMEINGERLFKDKFSQEVEIYLNSGGERRLKKRPDILLFPAEGKCILIEFKAPDVNAAEYLLQIDFYANLIRNYTNDSFQIDTFYGYLIGEQIEDRDVRGRVSGYEHSYHFDYWFRPSVKVAGYEDRKDGSIYSEVIKYSSLLNRAIRRNEIFIQKLMENDFTSKTP